MVSTATKAWIALLEKVRDALSSCSKIGDAGLASLSSQLKALGNLNMRYCSLVTDKGLSSLSGFTALQVLDIGWCETVTDAGLQSLTNLGELRELKADGCKRITDAGLSALPDSVTFVCANNCEWVCGAFLAHLRAIRTLELSGCPRGVSDESLKSMARLTTLQSVDISGCTQVTDSGISSLSALVNLRSLNISRCQVTDTGVSLLIRVRSGLEPPRNVAQMGKPSRRVRKNRDDD